MEIKIQRSLLLDVLSKSQGVVEKKNTMPVLAHVLLETTDSSIKLTATDLEVAYIAHIQAQVLQPGKITVSAKSLHDIVRELTLDEVKITLKENDRLEITSGKSRFSIPGISANEFPTIPLVSKEPISIPGELILGMIQKTAFAMSLDETRHHLAGVLLEQKENGKIRFVATDGHRLAVSDCSIPVDGFGNIRVIIPRKGINELKRMASREGSIEISIGDKNMVARKGDETLFVRLIDGEFPDYHRVIPQNNTKIATLPRDHLVGALRRVSLLSNERARGVMLSFSPGHLDISITNPDLGEAKEELEADYKNEKMSVGFNARYFLDVLDVIKKDTVTISLNTELAPAIIREAGDDSFLYVIMPMRL